MKTFLYLTLPVMIVLVSCASPSPNYTGDNYCWAYTAAQMLSEVGYTDYETALDTFKIRFPNEPWWVELALKWYLGEDAPVAVYQDRVFERMDAADERGAAVGVMIDRPGKIEHYINSYQLSAEDRIIEIVVLEPREGEETWN